MNIGTLKAHLKARGWSQSELARRVGVSRQAVSLWVKSGEAAVRSAHLLRLSEVLGVPMEELVQPLPGFGDGHDRLRTTYLWDNLYPGLDDFAIAVSRWELAAVGRFVQVDGLYAAERLLGRRVWSRFDSFKKLIHPVRRQQLEGLVQWRKRRTAA